MQLIGKRCPENKEQILTALDKQARELWDSLENDIVQYNTVAPQLGPDAINKILAFATQVREQTVAECAELLKDAIYDGESISAEIFNKIAGEKRL